jgi:ribokinase
MVDLVTRVSRLPTAGETLHGKSFAIGYGGKGGNQAVMAAKLGAKVTLVTRVGRDDFGDAAMANYRSFGLDLRYVRQDALHATGVAPIFVDDAAENCIVIVAGANSALTPADVHIAAQAITSAGVVVCQLEIPLETVQSALALARTAGIPTILNPAPAAAVPDALWALTDIAVPNESEAALLTGLPVDDDAQAERAARALLARGPRVVVLTLGRRGSLVVTSGETVHVAPLEEVRAVDTTGAGDAFVGTLAVCLAAGLTVVDAAHRANLVAGLSVTRAGTQTSFPDRATAQAHAATHGYPLPQANAPSATRGTFE